MSIQTTIDAATATLSPSLARVAIAIRENPAAVIDKTINELADACDTSVASVVRFCRAIGFSGYASLRMALAAELGKESAQFRNHAGFGVDISRDDSLEQVAGKLASLEMLAIEESLGQLDFDVLGQVVDSLDDAKRILLFGVGASQFVAQDLGHKLLRIGRPAFVLADAHEAVAAAVLPAAKTVAVAFSQLGETKEAITYLELARQNGAVTVGLTSAKKSSFAQAADLVLFTHARESTFRAGAMVSRIAQLAVVDCIFLGVAQRRFDETVEALERTRLATRALSTA